MISEEKLIKVLIKGKYECYVRKNETLSLGNINSLLQIENIYYEDILVTQQMTAGRLKYSDS